MTEERRLIINNFIHSLSIEETRHAFECAELILAFADDYEEGDYYNDSLTGGIDK